MIKVKREDKNTIISLLTEAFKDNLSVSYIVKQDKYKLKRIQALMDYSFEVCFLYGDIYLSEDHCACGMILFPQHRKMTLFTVWLDIVLIFKATTMGGIFKALKREKQIKKIQPKRDMLYLWFIGVDTTKHHRGYGSSLLTSILEIADNLNLPAFLETSTLENLPWYEHFGFEIYDKLDLGYTLFFLKKDI